MTQELNDLDKLRRLADWLDSMDRDGKYPTTSDGEVQADLRHIADELGECRQTLHRLAIEPEAVHLEWVREGIIKMDVKHWAVKLIAFSLHETIGNAKNFVTMEFGPLDVDGSDTKLAVTVQRVGSQSPAQILAELRARLTELESAGASALQWIERDETTHGRTFGAGNQLRKALGRPEAAT